MLTCRSELCMTPPSRWIDRRKSRGGPDRSSHLAHYSEARFQDLSVIGEVEEWRKSVGEAVLEALRCSPLETNSYPYR